MLWNDADAQKVKACSQCKKMLPLTAYHRRSQGVRSGRRAACKVCTWLVEKEARKQRHAANDPTQALKQRVRAHTAAALRRGEIERQPCKICGEEAQAHHLEYESPDAYLRVEWLCPLHHAREHGIHAWTRQLELPLQGPPLADPRSHACRTSSRPSESPQITSSGGAKA